MYSSTFPSTSALDGGGWSTLCPGHFTPGKDTVPIVQDDGWAPGPVWTGAENLAPPPGFDPRTVQPVASRYTDCAIAAPEINIILKMHNTKGKTAMVTPGASSLTVNRVLRIGVNPKTQPSLSSSSPPPSSSSQSS